jgi:hypothetical protein
MCWNTPTGDLERNKLKIAYLHSRDATERREIIVFLSAEWAERKTLTFFNLLDDRNIMGINKLRSRQPRLDIFAFRPLSGKQKGTRSQRPQRPCGEFL